MWDRCDPGIAWFAVSHPYHPFDDFWWLHAGFLHSLWRCFKVLGKWPVIFMALKVGEKWTANLRPLKFIFHDYRSRQLAHRAAAKLLHPWLASGWCPSCDLCSSGLLPRPLKVCDFWLLTKWQSQWFPDWLWEKLARQLHALAVYL